MDFDTESVSSDQLELNPDFDLASGGKNCCKLKVQSVQTCIQMLQVAMSSYSIFVDGIVYDT